MGVPTTGPVTYTATVGRDFFNSWATNVFTNCTDPDGDPIWLSSVGTPTKGTLNSIAPYSGLIWYTPEGTYTGTVTIDFVVQSASGVATNTSTITINVEAFDQVNEYARDAQSFYAPVLLAHSEMRLEVVKNNSTFLDLSAYTDDQEWTECTHRVQNVATNTTTQIDMSGVAYAKYLMLETDNAIKVSVNTSLGWWPVGGLLAIAYTDIPQFWVKNESTTNVAEVTVLFSD